MSADRSALEAQREQFEAGPRIMWADAGVIWQAAQAAMPASQDAARYRYLRRWISVTDRLPDTADAVLVWPHPEDGVPIACLPVGGTWRFDCEDHTYACSPTHWMPLPAGPGEPT